MYNFFCKISGNFYKINGNSMDKRYLSSNSNDVEIFDLSKFIKNIEGIAVETLEKMKKIRPEGPDSLYKQRLKLSDGEHVLSDLVQIVVKTPTLVHLHVYDSDNTLKILQGLQKSDNTLQGEIVSPDRIIVKLPKYHDTNKVKHLVDEIRKVHQNGADRIDVVRKKAQKYIDKVKGESKWHRQNSTLLKNTTDKANSSLSKLSKELIKNLTE